MIQCFHFDIPKGYNVCSNKFEKNNLKSFPPSKEPQFISHLRKIMQTHHMMERNMYDSFCLRVNIHSSIEQKVHIHNSLRHPGNLFTYSESISKSHEMVYFHDFLRKNLFT